SSTNRYLPGAFALTLATISPPPLTTFSIFIGFDSISAGPGFRFLNFTTTVCPTGILISLGVKASPLSVTSIGAASSARAAPQGPTRQATAVSTRSLSFMRSSSSCDAPQLEVRRVLRQTEFACLDQFNSSKRYEHTRMNIVVREVLFHLVR